jgi:hypothetical protein
MKKLVAIAVASVVTASAFGQGQIFFNNRVIVAGNNAASVVAPVYGPNPASPTERTTGNATTNINPGTVNYTGYPLVGGTSGSNYTAQLWYGPSGTGMGALVADTTAAGTVRFRTTAATAGFIAANANASTLNGVDFGAVAAVQMRVWDNRGGTINTWAEALVRQQADPTLAVGFSDIVNVALTVPPATPGNMVGLQSFSLTVVPEPSVIALGALGLGALLLRRRKS